MPSSSSASQVPTEPSYQGKIVLIHAHEDRLTPRSGIIVSLRNVARLYNYEFWWDHELSQPLFDEEIRRQLEEADVVVCILSDNFFDSNYIKTVEAPVLESRINSGLVVVPVKYRPVVEDVPYAWMKKLKHVPERVDCIYGSNQQLQLFKEVADYVGQCIRPGRRAPLPDEKALYSSRLLPNDSFTGAEQRRLQANSREWADKYVPSAEKQQQICQAARSKLASLESRKLSKSQLEELDKKLLMREEGRKSPDPKKIRWVLRAHGLHPQGRAKSLSSSRAGDDT